MKAGRGINAHVPSKIDIDKVVSFGCEWIRIDLDWRLIEPKKNSFSWSSYDTAISYAKQKGLKVYATIAYVPPWINSNYRACPDKENWTSFCKTIVNRYKTKVDVYSLWNEPNLKDFYKGTQKQYVNNILIPGYNAIKSVGNFVVAAGDLSTASGSSWNSWFKLLKKNSKYYDVFSWHTYSGTASKTISRYKFGKFSIIGWLIPKWRPFSWVLKGIKGKRIFLTETGLKAKTNKSSELKEQKDFVSKLDKIRKETKAEAIFYYDIKDYPQFKDKWGLIDDSGNLKPAAAWLQQNA